MVKVPLIFMCYFLLVLSLVLYFVFANDDLRIGTYECFMIQKSSGYYTFILMQIHLKFFQFFLCYYLNITYLLIFLYSKLSVQVGKVFQVH